ncbi:hypothetical protein OBBRIDRAFT_238495 [Obba rivulosa]|uniref:Uncharacterized protein n=1 Tax=Obba rivulosa TaxID=1052685 RepID=A0A8E2DQF6_9APHY|nr:hypothetical protein OBBRIDRAFT_238495 [Obba rivulosa]
MLLACSLVCRNWLTAMRRHLFSDVILESIAQYAKFAKLLDGSAQTFEGLERYVRSLTISTEL